MGRFVVRSPLFKVLICIAFFATFSAAYLSNDAINYPPASTGTYAYNTFMPGASYVDPVFNSTITRVTSDHTADDIYNRNMFWNANGTLYFHVGKIMNVASGTVAYSGIPTGSYSYDVGFDPVDPNAFYYYSGSSIHKVTLGSGGAWTDAVYFNTPGGQAIGPLGGTLNWLDKNGRYMVVRYGAEPSVYVYDRQNMSAGPFANPVNAANYIDANGYIGISPDGKYLIGWQDNSGSGNYGMGAGTSWPINAANRSVGSSNVFWTLGGDHASFVSASDGHDYAFVYDAVSQLLICRADITNNAAGLNESQQLALPNNKVLLTFQTWSDGGHMSASARSDWAFTATEDGSDALGGSTSPWHVYRQEIIGINVVTGEVRRIAHHRSRSVQSNYFYTPRVSASWGAEVVGWASNFDSSNADVFAAQFSATSGSTTPPAAAPAITTTALPGATLSTAYTTTLAASGGTPPYTWSISAGALPNGLGIGASTGTIAGTPSAMGTSSFTVKITDAASQTSTQALTLGVVSNVVSTSPFAIWKLDDGAGSSASDSSGNGNALSLGNSPAWQSGANCKASGCLAFDGTTQAASIPSLNLSDTNVITVAFWMQWNAFGGNDALALESTSNFNNATTGFMVNPNSSYNTGTSFEAGLKGDAGWNQVLFARPSAGVWHHYAFIFNKGAAAASQVIPYVDGVAVAYTKPLSAANTNNFGSDPLYLMSRAASSLFANGSLDEVRIYKRALSASEILSLLTVTALPSPSITTTSLPGATQNNNYSATVAATSGTVPYTWSIASGTLPPGVTLAASTGAISGMPSASGTSNFSVKVTDASSQTATQPLSITVNSLATSLSVTTSALTGGTQSTAYSATLAANGGTTPYTWSIVSGSLPAGLTLASSTGVIGGKPSATGASSFTVQVTDSKAVTATKALSITISAVTTSSAPWITGYFGGYGGQPPSTFPWSKYTHVVDFAVSTTGTGDVNLYWLTQTQIDQLIAARPAGKKVLISLKDNDNDYTLLPQSASPANIATFVSNIVNFINANGYDGIDLDWEKNVNATQYQALLSRLRIAMPTAIIALAGNPNNASAAAASQANVNQVNVMCYDLDWGSNQTWYLDALLQAGNSSVLTCDWDIAQFTNAGVAKAKIGVGMPLYARRWTGATQDLQPSSFSSAVTVLYRDLVSDTTRWQPQYKVYDTVYKSNYLTIPGMNEFDAYNGVEFINDYVAWVKSKGFGGYMTFSVDYEYLSGKTGDAANPLSTALYNTINGGTAPPPQPTPVSITTTTLASGSRNTPYSATLSATGGAVPYSWSIASGTLPAGLSLAPSTGIITGTPSSAGISSFTVQLTDGVSQTTTMALSITIRRH